MCTEVGKSYFSIINVIYITILVVLLWHFGIKTAPTILLALPRLPNVLNHNFTNVIGKFDWIGDG